MTFERLPLNTNAFWHSVLSVSGKHVSCNTCVLDVRFGKSVLGHTCVTCFVYIIELTGSLGAPLAKCNIMEDGLTGDVPSWCLSGLRFGPTAGSLFLLRFGCWSRRQAMACHGRVFNLRFDCVLNRFVYPSRSKLAFWSCVLNSVICVPEPCVSVLRSKDTKI